MIRAKEKGRRRTREGKERRVRKRQKKRESVLGFLLITCIYTKHERITKMSPGNT